MGLIERNGDRYQLAGRVNCNHGVEQCVLGLISYAFGSSSVDPMTTMFVGNKPTLRIAIIGAGNVCTTLGRRWLESNHEIHFGVRDRSSDKVKAKADTDP